MMKTGREVSSNYLNYEMQAMKEGGLTEDEYYFEGYSPQEWRLNRAARVGHMIALRVMNACSRYDEHEAARQKAGK